MRVESTYTLPAWIAALALAGMSALIINAGCGETDANAGTAEPDSSPTESEAPVVPEKSSLGRALEPMRPTLEGSFWRSDIEEVLSHWTGKRQPMTDLLRETYEKRAYRPVFLDSLWPNEAAGVLIKAVREIPSHGLPHSPYRPRALVPLYEALALDPESGRGFLTEEIGDNERLAKLEAQLPRTIYKRAKKSERRPEVRYRPIKDLPDLRSVEPDVRCLLGVVHDIAKGASLEPEEVADRCSMELTNVRGGLKQVREVLSEREREKASLALLDAMLLQAYYTYVLDFSIDLRIHPFKSNGPSNRIRLPQESKQQLHDSLGELESVEAFTKSLKGRIPTTPAYRQARKTLARYVSLLDEADEDALDELEARRRLKKGDSGADVKALQRRLAAEDYYDGPLDGEFSDTFHEAVVRYQRSHRLADGGVVGEQTIETLNTPLEWRVKQILASIGRYRESKLCRNPVPDYYVRVNLPAYELEVIRAGKRIRQHKVIVGSNKRYEDPVNDGVVWHARRTKLFETNINEIVINPNWIVPAGIVIDEIEPKMRANPTYLEQHNFKKVGDLLVQGPHESNPLGQVKFTLESTDSIYLHDTDKRHLFSELSRDLSHGCIRVHQPIKLATFFLSQQGVEASRIEKRASEGGTLPIKLEDTIPIFIEYNTLGFDDDGEPIFYPDIYYYDTAYWKKRTPITRRFP